MSLQDLLPLMTLVLGFGLSFVAETYRKSKEREFELADSLRAERARAYQAFLEAAQATATGLGEATAGYTHKKAADGEIEAAKLAVDRVFVPKLRNLEIIASDAALKHANAMWMVLRVMRDEVVAGQAITFKSPEYNERYTPYQDARKALIAAARADVVVSKA